MKNVYDYSAKRWRTAKGYSKQTGNYIDIDGVKFHESDILSPNSGIDYTDIHQEWALLAAIACHSQAPEDYADSLDMLRALPSELRSQIWKSFPKAVQAGLSRAKEQVQERAA